MKLHKVLFSTDFSAAAATALHYAAALAHQWDAELLIAHVIESAAIYEHAGQLFSGSAPDGRPLIEQMLKNVVPTECTVAFRHLLVAGNPATELVRLANEEHVDLIVMSTHGRTGFKHLLLGSVAEHVVRNAACPVLTIKPNWIATTNDVPAMGVSTGAKG